jgi:hypothetical protein
LISFAKQKSGDILQVGLKAVIRLLESFRLVHDGLDAISQLKILAGKLH